MFKINDEVICIDNRGYEKYLTIDKIYKIHNIEIGKVTWNIHLIVSYDIHSYIKFIRPLSYSVLSLKDYRKIKIQKICLNQMIK